MKWFARETFTKLRRLCPAAWWSRTPEETAFPFPFSQEGGGIRFYKRLLIRQGAFTTEMSRAEPTRLDSFEEKRSDEVIQEAIDLSCSL